MKTKNANQRANHNKTRRFGEFHSIHGHLAAQHAHTPRRKRRTAVGFISKKEFSVDSGLREFNQKKYENKTQIGVSSQS